MRHLLITLGTAVAVVALFLLARSTMRSDAPPAEPIRPAEPRPETPREPVSAASAGPVTITGLPELEAIHRQHGKVGEAMRTFLASTRGLQWNEVERTRMQELLHTIRNNVTEDDVPYLIDLFNRTPDPAFRWWFSWLVQQVPDGRFVDAMTEVYRIDPHRGIDALVTITTPLAFERYVKLMESETDPIVRQHAVVGLTLSDWDRREETISTIAKDPERAGAERLEALSALGRTGLTADSLVLLMDVALGPPKPITGLTGSLAASYPIADVRAGAVLGIMQRGDQEAARRLIEAADAPGADPNLGKMIDVHIGAFGGPDIQELIFDRIRRRGVVSPGEVQYLVRDPERADRNRLRDILPLVKDPDAKALLQRIIGS